MPAANACILFTMTASRIPAVALNLVGSSSLMTPLPPSSSAGSSGMHSAAVDLSFPFTSITFPMEAPRASIVS